MGIINVNIDKIYGRASQAEVDALKGEIEAANRMLYDGSGKGGDFLGWVSLPGRIGSEELEAVEACARSLASLADVIVVIGIGGSYLGTKARSPKTRERSARRSERPISASAIRPTSTA